jgi:cysteinyl-tRNA synthetase
MDLRLYDTLTRQKRAFVPLDPDNVRMYVCGPTVYDFAHIGNARPVIVFDVLFRLLRHLYGADRVTYVRNITDVDDKINDRAARDFPGLPLNEAIRKVTEVTEKQFHGDVDALGCLRPTIEPRATEHIPEMRILIERLVQGGFAYVAEDHVLFSPQAMNAANSILPRYGALAKRSLDEMIAGARVDVAPYKRDAADFVLWKPSKPGEPSWPSPSGIKVEGRPGWHIECSAMAWKHLGEQFDIHGGGIDLVFPHHENELAQTCCAFHEDRMANVWMHNGFLQVEGDKMSKSEGNFVTIRELLENWHGYSWPGETLRFNMLRTHYRQPIDWTFDSLSESHNILCDWYDDLKELQSDNRISTDTLRWLSDDLNTPGLITELHKFRKNKLFQSLLNALQLLGFSGKRENLARTVFVTVTESVNASDIIEGVVTKGIVGELRTTEAPDQMQARIKVTPSNDQIEQLVSARTAARARKDFKESDRIRDELTAMGVTIKDSKEGTTWEITR